MRQFSIADITLSCSRLTRPALACRHAGPWSRKISATSNFVRDIAARYAAGWLFSPISGFLPGFFLGFLRGCDSRSSGLFVFAIMPVATRV